jgi:hypothetical protein
VCSLPVTRRAIVSAKYVGGWVVALAAAGVAVAAMLMLSGSVQSVAWPLSLLGAVVVGVIGLVLALMLPFTLRFGIAGVFIVLVSLQVLGIIVLLTVSMLGGSPVRGAFGAVAPAVIAARTRLGDHGFAVFAVAAVALLNIASWRLSVLVYGRREF